MNDTRMLNDKKQKLTALSPGFCMTELAALLLSGFGDTAVIEHQAKDFVLGNGCTIFKLAEGFLCYSFVLPY